MSFPGDGVVSPSTLQDPKNMATSPFPAKIGKYDVLGVIGRGGMGVVYQARDPHLDRRVAIKMITGGFSDAPDMLKRRGGTACWPTGVR